MALITPSLTGPACHLPDRDIHELFFDVAAQKPAAVAVASEPLDDIRKVVDDDALDASGAYRLSFGELRERVGHLSAEIRARTSLCECSEVAPLVAICLQRTPALLVALLGTLAAGAAYVPLEPTHPGERLHFILEDSRAEVLVTCWCARRRGLLPEERLVRVTAVDGQLIPHGGAAAEASARPPADRGVGARPSWLERPAYLTYTSGSTGKPKGVLVPRRGVVNVLHAFHGLLAEARGAEALDGRCALLAVTTYCFDISVLELLLPPCFGLALFLASAATARNGAKLRELLELQPATVLQGTPATWRSLLRAGWAGREGLGAICGGEAFPPALAAPLLRCAGAGLWNAYGPTEATIWATVHRLGSPGSSSTCSPVPIGKPLPNTELFVIESELVGQEAEGHGRSLHEAPSAAVGELLIGGAGVALGYHCRPSLTASHFVPRPGAAPEGPASSFSSTVYRTGDLVRLLPDGELDFLGRADQQVKFRGFRIELGEIEAALEQHPAVGGAVAALGRTRRRARSSHDDGLSLVAFVTPGGPGSPQPEEEAGAESSALPAAESDLRAHLAAKLPAYMVPHSVSFVPAFPLTNSGKVDRKGLVDALCGGADGEEGRADASKQEAPGAEGPAGISSASTQEDGQVIRRRVAELIVSSTGVAAALDSGAADSTLAALGIDSVSAVPLAEALGKSILGGRAEVPLELLLSDGNLASLCGHLASL